MRDGYDCNDLRVHYRHPQNFHSTWCGRSARARNVRVVSEKHLEATCQRCRRLEAKAGPMENRPFDRSLDLVMWTVHWQARDFPDRMVARLGAVNAQGMQQSNIILEVAPSEIDAELTAPERKRSSLLLIIRKIRKHPTYPCDTWLPRDPSDEPQICGVMV